MSGEAQWRWIEEPAPTDPRDPACPPRKRLVDVAGKDVVWGYVATAYDDDLPTGIDAEPAVRRLLATVPKLLALARYAAERGEGDAEMAREILREIDGP